jgi:hypothetical protein
VISRDTLGVDPVDAPYADHDERLATPASDCSWVAVSIEHRPARRESGSLSRRHFASTTS